MISNLAAVCKDVLIRKNIAAKDSPKFKPELSLKA
jgi:hypothetical protein